ncbi:MULTISPECIES: quinone oxidoreductase family protein [unclassified Glutamicibacter]|uniref:quinone oxidoreductase family protein n=1 Tax=unclassified Glutamicibacter TaxID=2627139 RepID=UPI00380DFB0E
MSHNVVAHEAGGPEVLKYEPMELPPVGSGQLLVEVGATGVNFIETYRRAGQYAVDYPFVPGSECAGTVVAVGDGITSFSVGDRVATMWGKKTYATHTLIEASKAVRIPDNVQFESAAAMLSQGITAHYLSVDCYPVRKEHTVLIHAGAGGVGRLLIQLSKLAGATVIATTSTTDKAAVATEAGADFVIGYEGFAAKVRELTEGLGVDVVFDGVGKDTFDGSLESLKVRGTLVLFGGSSGPVPPFQLQRLNTYGSLYVTRPKTGDYLRTDQERQRRINDVLQLVSEGKLKIRVGRAFPLAEAAQAHAALENRETTGKTVLVP